MVSIILVSFNKGEVTKDCVNSIHRNVTIPYEIIIVDNGSEQETISILKNLVDVRLIETNCNSGFPTACNIGLSAARGELIWFLNNDTIVPPNSLECMVKLLLSDDSIGMVGPVTNNINGIQKIPIEYTDYSGIDSFALNIRNTYAGQVHRVIRLVGFSMLLRASTLMKLGGLEERMGIGTFEDDDLSLRLIENGYQLLVARDAFIHHIGSASFIAAGGYPTIGDTNQRIVSTKFGMTIPTETVLNEALIQRIRPEALKILHVECGAGAFGLWAKDRGKYIVCMESSKRKIRIAKYHYDDAFLYSKGSIFEYKENSFDTLVIEKQLSDKETYCILQSLRPNLKPGAQILIHIPFMTAQYGDSYKTYYDKWTEQGFEPVMGRFDLKNFIEDINKLGLYPKNITMEEAYKGFFNRCSYKRYQQSLEEEDLNAFEFFQSCIIELDVYERI